MIARIVSAVLLSISLAGTVAAGQPSRGRPALGRGTTLQPPPKKWNESEYVFVARLDRVDAGPVGRSLPPVYSHKLHFTVEKVLRGPLTPGAKIVCSHVARQHKPPVFPVGKVCLVAASKSRGQIRAEVVEPSTSEKLTEITLACSLPMGWKVADGKPLSPWSSMGNKAWSGAGGAAEKLVCSKTGRPALFAGEDVTFRVESVPPEVAIKWTNPDGDGEYKITVANTTDKPISVPALLCDGKRILWEESLAIICQDKVYPCPGSRGVSGKVEPLRLKPGQSVSTTVNALSLNGPEWPRGGYRIEFRFCLGEKSQTKSFYYMSRHHDKIRKAGSGSSSGSN